MHVYYSCCCCCTGIKQEAEFIGFGSGVLLCLIAPVNKEQVLECIKQHIKDGEGAITYPPPTFEATCARCVAEAKRSTANDVDKAAAKIELTPQQQQCRNYQVEYKSKLTVAKSGTDKNDVKYHLNLWHANNYAEARGRFPSSTEQAKAEDTINQSGIWATGGNNACSH